MMARAQLLLVVGPVVARGMLVVGPVVARGSSGPLPACHRFGPTRFGGSHSRRPEPPAGPNLSQ